MRYLTYEEFIALYTVLMRDKMKETYYGVLNEGLLRSALARPENAAKIRTPDAKSGATDSRGGSSTSGPPLGVGGSDWSGAGSADGIEQAAYLFHGLLMNHGFAQGNKRVAYLALEWFLEMNSLGAIVASDDEIIATCFTAENDKWDVEKVAKWLRMWVK